MTLYRRYPLETGRAYAHTRVMAGKAIDMFKAPGVLSHVYGWPDLVVLGARDLIAQTHASYPAITVCIALGGAFKIEIQGRCHEVTGMIVAARESHRYDAGSIDSFVALYSFAHPDYARLADFVRGQRYRCLDGARFRQFRRTFARLMSGVATCEEARSVAHGVAKNIVLRFFVGGEPMDRRVTTVILRLHRGLGPLPRLSDLAKEVRLSSERLRHLFKQQTGTSLRSYLKWVKATRAVCLAAARDSVTEVAVDAGFSDAAHMSRTIRETFGLSPSFFAARQRVQMHSELQVSGFRRARQLATTD